MSSGSFSRCEYSNDTLGDGQAFAATAHNCTADGAIITSGHLQALAAAEKS
jgi:hypothetical protein